MSSEFDINILAENGLRRGRTTGTCATAAVKAALLLLIRGESEKIVSVSLPGSDQFLSVPIATVRLLDDGSARADVIKDAGDDPDQTHLCTIFSIVKINRSGATRFFAASGVGIVTQPGIRVPVGEAAINPAPRQMMLAAVQEVLNGEFDPGFDLAIGCENGEEIAKKTFNPRLGIVGGISILGTTGIVEPMSLAAYQAAIEVYIRVALGDRPKQIAFLPGNIGLKFGKEVLGLERKEMVHISNFIGFSLNSVTKILQEENFRLKNLWFLGHPGKIAKILDGVLDTHSKNSSMAMSTVAKVAESLGFDDSLIDSIRSANTVEAITTLIEDDDQSKRLWSEIEDRVSAAMQQQVPDADHLLVRLFSMDGTPLGRAA
jgi:cobalt-precorrin-5B (C1)-methyltransferase